MADEYSDEEQVIYDGVVYEPTRIQNAFVFSENVRAVARSPKVLGLLRDLYGREPLPFQTLNFHVGTQQPAHADALHFNSMPAGFMCGVWLALEDIDMDNGPLIYYPGSHKLPEIQMRDFGAEARHEDYPKYEAYVRELIEREGLEPEYGTIRKGQALLWASNLLHGGAVQQDMSRTRHSQVTHYFFEGCRYYTPMLSTDTETHWRDPAWVT
jgi:ectoine hydroxylase-related dioxygenase (phytanoyl-CoA dioxygenase family)